MKKKLLALTLGISMMFSLTGCGASNPTNAGTSEPAHETPASTPSEVPSGPLTVSYLGEEYTFDAPVEKIIITGTMESMEDAVLLDVKPVGAIAVSGKFPELFAGITANAESIGEKSQPSFETIAKLTPDVILGSTKFPAEVVEQLKLIAPVILVSHVSTNWEANLNLLADLTGNQTQVESIIKDYTTKLEATKTQLAEPLKDKSVLMVRFRQGNINIYPADMFFNASLYTDLALTVPKEVSQAKSQQQVSLEQLSDMNPDYLFVQFSADENADHLNALESLEKNPIWQNINAVKNGRVFVNTVDPLLQGGTALSKITFLEDAISLLAK